MSRFLVRFSFFCLLVLLSWACDRVKETPEPDPFLALKLVEIESATDSSGTFYLDIIHQNQIKTNVNISFSTPSFGQISPDLSNNRFRYQAFDEAAGIDSFEYYVSNGGLPKKGKIKLTVQTPPCIPGPSLRVTYDVSPVELDTLFFIPFDSEDRYCKSKKVKIISENAFYRFYLVSYDQNGLYLQPRGDILSGQQYRLNYQVSVPGSKPILKTARFTIGGTSLFCNHIFKVRDIAIPFQLPAQNGTLIVYRDLLKSMVISCDNDVVPQENWFINEGLTVEYTSPTIVKLRKGISSTARFGYRFENSGHRSDTGWANIIFH